MRVRQDLELFADFFGLFSAEHRACRCLLGVKGRHDALKIAISALAPKADIPQRCLDVRFSSKSGHRPLHSITTLARRPEAIGTDAAAGRCARRKERICRTASGIRSFGSFHGNMLTSAFGASIAVSIATA
jgi:hypothetical protein